jgi:hypothetical protein
LISNIRSTRDRHNAESNRDGGLTDAERTQSCGAKRVQDTEYHAGKPEIQDHRPSQKDQRKTCQGGEREQADAELRHFGRSHDACLDESRAARVRIYAIVVPTVRSYGLIANIIENVTGGVDADRREQGEHEDQNIEMAGRIESPRRAGKYRQYRSGKELRARSVEETLGSLRGRITGELLR